jgi:hypothetical protein
VELIKHIKRSQIVSENDDGTVSYITAAGELVRANPDTFEVIEDAEEVEALGDVPTPDVPAKAKRVRAPRKVAKPKEEKPKSETGDKTMAKAKKKAAKKAGNGSGAAVRTISGKTVDLSKYVAAKAPGGGKSFNNGDDVATKLAGKDLDSVYSYAAKTLKVEEKELRSKYKHLNPGMQRMNLGNRLRKGLNAKAA